MSQLQIDTPIGLLFVTDVFAEYDGPRVFACESSAGQLYLGLWVEEEPSTDRWLFVPMSRDRLPLVKVGVFSLREAITEAEDGWVWLLTFEKHSERWEPPHQIAGREVPDLYLPDPEARLRLKDDRMPALREEPLHMAERLRREVVFVYLDGDAGSLNEVTAEHLGSTLLRLQRLATTLGHDDVAPTGRFPRAVVEETTLMVTGMVAGSFGVRLESRCLSDLFGTTKVATTLAKLMDLLEASRERDSLRQALLAVKPRAAARYRFLLRALSDGDSGLKAHWGSPSKRERQVALSLKTVRGALAFLDERTEKLKHEFSVHGRLTGVSTDRMHFEFVSDDGTRYEGHYASQVRGETLKMRLDKDTGGVEVTATLEETLQLTAAGEEKLEYLLVGIIPDVPL